MKLDKAIEILETLDHAKIAPHNPDLSDAIKLGTEALTYIIRLRAFSLIHNKKRLPSEDGFINQVISQDEKKNLRESPLGGR